MSTIELTEADLAHLEQAADRRDFAGITNRETVRRLLDDSVDMLSRRATQSMWIPLFAERRTDCEQSLASKWETK